MPESTHKTECQQLLPTFVTQSTPCPCSRKTWNAKKTVIALLVALFFFRPMAHFLSCRRGHGHHRFQPHPISTLATTNKFPAVFSQLNIHTNGSAQTRFTVISTTESDASVSFSITSTEDEDALSKTTLKAGLVDNDQQLSIHVASPEKHVGKLIVEATIALPQTSLDAFTFMGQVGSLDYAAAASIVSAFTAEVHVGSINTHTVLRSKAIRISINAGSVTLHDKVFADSMDITVNAGDVNIYDATVSDYAKLNANTGKIHAVVSGYKSFSALNYVGEVVAELEPGQEESESILQTDTGSIRATAAKFLGHFEAQTRIGSVSVEGADEMTRAWNKVKGSVGGVEKKGTLKATSTIGSVDLVFKK
ncbi:hypothetical protein BJ741DRAFT_614141 [Chytriomyces cf. hyalinus JEL632]|nr:hypothetical protein BJ741DRAFT_614141 [Chytriomyces cf. hyalinus JEL632]